MCGGRPEDLKAAEEVLRHAAPFDWSLYERPTVDDMHVLDGMMYPAHGPDGIPYSAWKAGGWPAAQANLSFILCCGARCCPDCKTLSMFSCRGEGPLDSVDAAAMKPLALKNAGGALGDVCAAAAQRGFISGRSLLENRSEMDLCLRHMAAVSA